MKAIFAATAIAAAMPMAALANAGHDMQAALLNVDAASFTTSELAQIASEEGIQDRSAQAKFILSQKNSGAAVAFTSDDARPYGSLGTLGRGDH